MFYLYVLYAEMGDTTVTLCKMYFYLHHCILYGFWPGDRQLFAITYKTNTITSYAITFISSHNFILKGKNIRVL